MAFSLVVKKFFVFLTVSLLCVAVFTAAYNFPIEEINPQKKLDYLLPNHRTPWKTDHFDEQRVYNSTTRYGSCNLDIEFYLSYSEGVGFATTRKTAVDQDRLALDEVVQSLSGVKWKF